MQKKANGEYFPRGLKSLLWGHFGGHFSSFFLLIQNLNFAKLASLKDLSFTQNPEKNIDEHILIKDVK